MLVSDDKSVNSLLLNNIFLIFRGSICIMMSFGDYFVDAFAFDSSNLNIFYGILILLYGFFSAQLILACPILAEAYERENLNVTYGLINMFKGLALCFTWALDPGLLAKLLLFFGARCEQSIVSPLLQDTGSNENYPLTFQIAGGLIIGSSLFGFAMEKALNWEKNQKSKKDTENSEKNTPSTIIVVCSGDAGTPMECCDPEMRTESETANLLTKASSLNDVRFFDVIFYPTSPSNVQFSGVMIDPSSPSKSRYNSWMSPKDRGVCKLLVCAHINVRSRLRVRRFVCDRVRKFFQKCACGCVRETHLRADARTRPHVHSGSVKILQSMGWLHQGEIKRHSLT